jgi:PAS domain-containing protein
LTIPFGTVPTQSNDYECPSGNIAVSGKNQLSSILKHAPIALALCQSPGNVTSTNSTFEELLGLSSNQIPCALELMQDGNESRSLISERFQGRRESFQLECAAWGVEPKSLSDGMGRSWRGHPNRERGCND